MLNRGYRVFPSKICASTVLKKFRGDPFNVSEILGCQKVLCILGGITIFRRKYFVSLCRKNSRASLQCFRKLGVSKNFMHNRGITIFVKIFLSHCAEKFRGHALSVSESLRYHKIFCIIGGITYFRRKYVVSQC